MATTQNEKSLRTKLCDMLGIKYPIIQAAMAWVINAEMVAAVSNAGGLGTLGLSAGQTIIKRSVSHLDRLLPK